MSWQGKAMWLCSQADGDVVVIATDANGNVDSTSDTVANEIFMGDVSGAILGVGRTASGELVPIKVTEFGAI